MIMIFDWYRWPDNGTKEQTQDNDFALQLAVKKNAPKAVVDALIAASAEIVVFDCLLNDTAALLPWFRFLLKFK